MSSTESNPHFVLGLSSDATEAELRARYLELVKAFPPERAPDKFREIRAAYEAASDPLTLAMTLIEPPDNEEGEAPAWSEALVNQSNRPPQLSPPFLISLGNRQVPGPANSKTEKTA